MSDDNEERGGISAGGVILGAGGATGAAYLGDKMLSRNGVAEAWKGAKEAPKAVTEKISALFKQKDVAAQAMKTQADGINAFNKISDPNAAVVLEKAATEAAPPIAKEPTAGKLRRKERRAIENAKKHAPVEAPASAPKAEAVQKSVSESKFVTDEAKKVTHLEFNEHTTGKPVGQKIKIDSLPKDQAANAVLKSEETIGKAFTDAKPLVQNAEKTLTTELRAATGLNKVGSGLKFGSNVGRGKVAAAVVAAAAVSYGIGSMMFPSHARRIDNERAAQRDMGRA